MLAKLVSCIFSQFPLSKAVNEMKTLGVGIKRSGKKQPVAIGGSEPLSLPLRVNVIFALLF